MHLILLSINVWCPWLLDPWVHTDRFIWMVKHYLVSTIPSDNALHCSSRRQLAPASFCFIVKFWSHDQFASFKSLSIKTSAICIWYLYPLLLHKVSTWMCVSSFCFTDIWGKNHETVQWSSEWAIIGAYQKYTHESQLDNQNRTVA